MSSNRVAIFVICSLIPFGGFAQTAPSASTSPAPTTKTSSASDEAELTRLLNDFLAGASRNDIAAHERFWAEDVIYTSSAGKRRGKTEILDDVRKAPSSQTNDEKTTYSAEDIRVQQYDSTAIVAFRLVGTTTKANKTETADYLNTGTFLKRKGIWQVVAWQATKIPPEDEQK